LTFQSHVALIGKELLSEGKYESLEAVSTPLFAPTSKTGNPVSDIRLADSGFGTQKHSKGE